MTPEIEIAGISFRPIIEKDLPFLLKLYRSTREEELNLAPWTESEKAQFINQQFQAQHQYYQEYYGDAWFDIIVINHQKVGRLYLEVRDDEFRIIDIAILPEFRGKGWGTKILEEIISLANENDKGIGIHVEKNNPAMNLYLRLGFQNVEDKGVYQFMMWNPKEINDK